jgi:hypothetical protein
LPAELLLQVLAKLGGNVRDQRVEGGHESSVKRQQILAVAVDGKKRPEKEDPTGGQMLRFFKYFRGKISRKKLAFFTQNKAKF